MDKIELGTQDITQENVKKLIELFPQVATEVEVDGEVERSVDFDALRELLGDVAEGQRERYQFTWPGKREAKAEARRPIAKTLRPCKEKSKNWEDTENLYIEGDNLDALKILRETYAGKVKLIYIDPPYNTGHDFVYDDDFAQTRGEYDGVSGDYDDEGGRLVANTEGNGRFHSDWCSMMYPRLLLARDLLSADGAMFISIDDGEGANLRKLCDEVFGAACFVGDVAWQRTYSPRNDSKGIPAEVEHLLVYAKQAGWMPKRLPRTAEMDKKYANPDGDIDSWRPDNAYAPGAATHQGMVYAIQHPFTGEYLYPSTGRCWTFGQADILEIMNQWCPYRLENLGDDEKRASICGCSTDDVRKGVKGIVLAQPLEKSSELARHVQEVGPWPKLYFTKDGLGGIARKTYLSKVEGRMPTSLWLCDETGHTDEAKKELKKLFDGSAPFDTPKPVRLMRRILDIASDKDSLVLDFFSGSASMAHAVIDKNAEDGGSRRFVLVQIPEGVSGEYDTLCGVGEERIRRAGVKIAAEVEEANRQLELGAEPKPVPDIGFRAMRIDSSNFRDVSASPEETSQQSILDLVDNVKDGRSDLDLLFEVLPKFRIPYSALIEERSIAGKNCFVVNDGQLVACFDALVGTETIEEIAKMQPLYAVMRDASMADDSTCANFEELFKTHSPDTVRRVI